jgi:tRNA threonylcarbamoyladenosine biosynthesis protein TsaB
MTNRSTPAGIVRASQARGFAGKKTGAILALETGGRACSVAIFVGNTLLAQETETTDHGQATMLMPMIERVRLAAGCDYATLARIAVAVGPGSFTGIRIGLAAALGLSLASGVPAVGISSFQTAAAGIRIDAGNFQGFRLFVLLDSRREEPFLAELDADLAFVGAPAVVTPDQLDAILAGAGPVVLAGDAPAALSYRTHPLIHWAQTAPNALMVAALADDPARRYDLPPKPIYLRAPDVTMPRPA